MQLQRRQRKRRLESRVFCLETDDETVSHMIRSGQQLRTFVCFILVEETANNIPNAACDVDERTFLALKRISVTRTSARGLSTYLTTILKQQRAQDPRLW